MTDYSNFPVPSYLDDPRLDRPIRLRSDLDPTTSWTDKVQFEEWGLIFDSRNPLSQAEFYAMGTSFAQMRKSLHYWIGDWVRYGVDRWGEEFFQAIDEEDWADSWISQEFGYSYRTVMNDYFVADAVPHSVRKLAPAFSYSDAVAILDPSVQEKVLKQARRLGWNTSKVRDVKNRILVAQGKKNPTRRRVNPEERFRRLVGLYLMVEDAVDQVRLMGGNYARRKAQQKKRIRKKIIRALEREGK